MEQTTVLQELSAANKLIAASLITDYPVETALAPPEEPITMDAFSPEQMETRAHATTRVLADILEQATLAHDFRHWGINE
jgi:hypothetical protein